MSSSKVEITAFKIPLEEIKLATENFSAANCIGGGSFGKVYRGKLPDSRWDGTVAIKQLNPDGLQGKLEFRNEVSMLHNCKHKNIVNFIGYCDEDKEMIIVYEYAFNGSLDKHLGDKDKMSCITWEQRLEICIGAAEGLNHLHSGLGDNLRVIHRDVKSANVLLDEDLEPKISDFGLSKFGPKNQRDTHINTRVAGTLGYLDPLYYRTDVLTKESDVYSFGVVLFEMLSGRLLYPKKKCAEGNDNDDDSKNLLALVDLYKDQLDQIVDSCIKDEIKLRSFHTFKEIACQCLEMDNARRPEMATVVKRLREALNFQVQVQHDVFISFRGEDVRKSFVSHLYFALDQRGINTFRDEELKRGVLISTSIFKAIKESSVAIIIFTQNYADSRWCLDELAKIMEYRNRTNKIVLPVFYGVSPSEVRKQRGRFGYAFDKHESVRDSQTVQVWREALFAAANLSGWEINNTANRDEAQVITSIVDFVSGRLHDLKLKAYQENLVGMESRVNDLKSLLEIGLPDVRMIGICGIAGGGKTAVARALFNDIPSDQFDGECFVENVKEHSRNSQMTYLQEKVLSVAEKNMRVTDVYEGTQMIKNSLSSKKVFLVLHDVDHIDQLEELAGAVDWFGSGSRIIITTRDEHILSTHGVTEIFRVDLLKEGEDIELFSRYAFGESSPKEGYEEASRRVVKYAARLPLTLRVLGCFLYGRDMLEWDRTVKRLQTIPKNNITEILKIGYDGLEDEHKKVFLHVACFFWWWSIDEVSRILDSCGFSTSTALDVLVKKSLIRVLTKENNRLGMHDYIQETGKYIVHQMHRHEHAGMHSLLWSPDKIWWVLEKNKGTDAIESIVTDKEVKRGVLDIREAFKDMKKLRILHINTFMMRFQGPESLPDGLRWLSWKYYPQETLPENFQANELIGLELPESEIVQLQNSEGIKDLGKLKFLNLHGCKITKTPDFMSTPDLERLDLQYCSKLEEIHPSVGVHESIVFLNLRGCENLISLPPLINMISLKTLDVSKCSRLKKLPDFSRGMGRLKELISSDNTIEELPLSIGSLYSLVYLDVSGCKNLKSLPSTICTLEHLEVLDLEHCSSFEELPENLQQIKSLRHLLLAGTAVQMPEWFQ